MNKRVFLTSGVAATLVVGGALVMHGRQIQAQPLPLDECISVGDSSPRSRLCMHEFSDHSKCVVAVTPGKEFAATQLSCKIL
jgi:hypothetical protein